MKQSYHAYRRRVRLIRRPCLRELNAWLNCPEWKQYTPRKQRLLKQARRNFEAGRRKWVGNG